MSSKGFNMGDFLANVPSLGTELTAGKGREQITYISIDLLDDDPKNFYNMDGVPGLAASIELLGLQQPIRVREGDFPGRYTVVSGHRRKAALQILAGEGKTEFSSVPCIVQGSVGSEAMRELALIFANSDTRKMSSADMARQAERVEMLLYELKEEGIEFPGRMRDHVAEACRISKSKLSRLKVIREKLSEDFRPAWESGELNETVAYALAQQPEDVQRLVLRFRAGNGKFGHLHEGSVNSVKNAFDQIAGQECPKGGGQCGHWETIMERRLDVGRYAACQYNSCCASCSMLASCKTVCPLLKDKQAELKADAKAQKKLEAELRAEKERPDVELVARLWQRFGAARSAAGKSVAECYKAVQMFYAQSDVKKQCEAEDGKTTFNPSSSLPYGYSFNLSDAKHIVAAADLLGVSLDYLFCRTDEPGGMSGGAAARSQWQTGEPAENGEYLVKVNFGGYEPSKEIFDWDSNGHCWHAYGEIYSEDSGPILGWIKLPEEDWNR